jgi:hypothetical protein
LNPTSGPGYDVDARNTYGPPAWPKLVSVSVPAESPFDGFQEVGQFTLAQEARDQEFSIGRPAWFLKVRILQNFGGPRYTTLGEVKLTERSAPGYESILRTAEATVVTSAARSARRWTRPESRWKRNRITPQPRRTRLRSIG